VHLDYATDQRLRMTRYQQEEFVRQSFGMLAWTLWVSIMKIIGLASQVDPRRPKRRDGQGHAVKTRASLVPLRLPWSIPCLSFTPTNTNRSSTIYRIMSDSEPFDIDDELLELAGASEKKRKRKQEGKPSSKRRRQE
jgi:hypothetical protein